MTFLLAIVTDLIRTISHYAAAPVYGLPSQRTVLWGTDVNARYVAEYRDMHIRILLATLADLVGNILDRAATPFHIYPPQRITLTRMGSSAWYKTDGHHMYLQHLLAVMVDLLRIVSAGAGAPFSRPSPQRFVLRRVTIPAIPDSLVYLRISNIISASHSNETLLHAIRQLCHTTR